MGPEFPIARKGKGRLITQTTKSPSTMLGAIPRGTPAPAGVRRLQVILIHPSKYDDDGYVMRYVRGVLPSNTLAALVALTEQVTRSGELGGVPVGITVLDEHVHRIDVRDLLRRYLRRGIRPVVALCGVQTNQFPRAADLALRFRAAGVPTMIGGFHVSGAIAMSEGKMPPECAALLDAGVTLVKGEVEACWGDLLRDALHGALRGFYDVVKAPELDGSELPRLDRELLRRFAYPRMATVDASRGCPFDCSFCTIIQVQGKGMRTRSPSAIRDGIRNNAALNIDYYFFTDDNFARNPHWEEILDAIIELRRDEAIRVEFMMQVDVLAYRLPRFVEKAAEAGCTQVFIGMETLNPANIPAAGKRQNRVEDYRNMVDAWRASGIACHVGYIVGFPFDTPDSVAADIRRLRDEIRVDQASFFILTPIPGSRDHRDLVRRGEWMEGDLNRYDSFHVTTHHPGMTGEEWMGAYRKSWQDFYSVDSMIAVLARSNVRTYWGLLKNFAWYRYSLFVEETHPMLCGFFRIKDRRDRRPGHQVDSVVTHARARLRETVRWARRMAALYFELQEVWLATRGRAQIQDNLDGIRKRYTDIQARVGGSKARAAEAIGRRVADVRHGAAQAWQGVDRARREAASGFAARIDVLRGPAGSHRSVWSRLAWRLNPFAVHVATRAPLDAFWRQTVQKLRRGRLHRINPLSLAFALLRDVKLCTRFNIALLSGYGK